MSAPVPIDDDYRPPPPPTGIHIPLPEDDPYGSQYGSRGPSGMATPYPGLHSQPRSRTTRSARHSQDNYRAARSRRASTEPLPSVSVTPVAGTDAGAAISEGMEAPKEEQEPPRKGYVPKEGELGVLEWSGRFAGGLVADIKRRAPYYKSDFTDAFTKENFNQIVPTVLFVFFACYAPALAFGALFDIATEGQFGIVEMVLSTAICGVLYSLFSGQPLTIMGATGPELAYTIVFFQMCRQLDIEFLPARFWQGLWTALFTVLLAVTDSCCLMHYVTGFTEEIFSALISILEVYAALANIIGVFMSGVSVGAALLTLILAAVTFVMANKFKVLRASSWFNKNWRKNLSNYGVIITILVVTVVANLVIPAFGITDLAFLRVPESIRPTYTLQSTGQPRPWIINPFGIERDFPVWGIFFTAAPALGLTILGYLDQNLTEVIVNRKDRLLMKPAGYHLDLFTCGAFLYPVCTLLSLPFTHAATVRSLAHTLSLTTYDLTPTPDGKGTISTVSGAIEQRFSHLIVHLLMFVSLALTPVLRLVPQSIIIGIFLYLGVSSIAGNEMFDRFYLLFIFEKERWPEAPYLSLPTARVHRYTAWQLGSWTILFIVSRLPGVAIAFPFMIALLIPMRLRIVNRFFTAEELELLD